MENTLFGARFSDEQDPQISSDDLQQKQLICYGRSQPTVFRYTRSFSTCHTDSKAVFMLNTETCLYIRMFRHLEYRLKLKTFQNTIFKIEVMSVPSLHPSPLPPYCVLFDPINGAQRQNKKQSTSETSH